MEAMPARSRLVVLDKTGTVTRGEHRMMTDVIPADGVTEEELLLHIALTLESQAANTLSRSAVVGLARKEQRRGNAGAIDRVHGLCPGSGLQRPSWTAQTALGGNLQG